MAAAEEAAISLDHEVGHLQRILAKGEKGMSGDLPDFATPVAQLRRAPRGQGQQDIQYYRASVEWDALFTSLVSAWNRLTDKEREKIQSVTSLVKRVFGSRAQRTGQILGTLGQDSPKWRQRTMSRLNREGIPIRRWGRPKRESFESMVEGKRICAWCKKVMGEKPKVQGVTHGICDECAAKMLKDDGGEEKSKNESFEQMVSLNEGAPESYMDIGHEGDPEDRQVWIMFSGKDDIDYMKPGEGHKDQEVFRLLDRQMEQ